MSEAEYISILWKVITAEGALIMLLVGVIWRHVIEDRRVRTDLQKCKDALGINGQNWSNQR